MFMIRLLYPGGKTKALTFSYDDGKIHDRRLVKLFNTHGLKATFQDVYKRQASECTPAASHPVLQKSPA